MISGEDFIKQWEQLRLIVYGDQNKPPVFTVGWGHAVLPEDHLKEGDTITQEQAENFFQGDYQNACDKIDDLCDYDLSEGQSAALVSLCFRIGIGAFRNSTLLKLLNEHKIDDAADEFPKWNKVHINGILTVSQGLTNRGNVERDLFLTGDET